MKLNLIVFETLLTMHLAKPVPPPTSETELLERANALAGKSLAQLANNANIYLPENLNSHKGWVGDFIETLLGADAGSLAEPDFIALGIELKTMPLNINGKPKESTFVCNANAGKQKPNWQQSLVKKKLTHVLWVPIEGDKQILLAERKVGSPFLWQMDTVQEQKLSTDYLELAEYLYLGEFHKIHAKLGEVLQIRPKAANARSLTTANNDLGESINTLPRGYYLRTSFTNTILAAAF